MIKVIPPKGVMAPSQFIPVTPATLKIVSKYNEPENKPMPKRKNLYTVIKLFLSNSLFRCNKHKTSNAMVL